jgi:deubiquitinase DESI2
MPPGCIAAGLWPLGLSLLHTGIVLNDREYAYGAADAATTEGNQTGIFWTRPRVEPPGGTFRCSILQGITFLSPTQIEEVLQEASTKFLGSQYNLLDNNCNHFTDHMCQALTHKGAPAWINRASKMGKVLPCLVPRDWLQPTDADSAGEWGSAYEDEDAVEGSNRLQNITGEPHRPYRDEIDGEEDEGEEAEPRTPTSKARDSEGRGLPRSEQAPTDRLI